MNEANPSSQSQKLDIQEFASRSCCFSIDHPDYRPPAPEEVRSLRLYVGLGQTGLARLSGVPFDPKKGSNTVRKWETPMGNPNHKPIPYSAWRLLLLVSGVLQPTQVLSQARRSSQ